MEVLGKSRGGWQELSEFGLPVLAHPALPISCCPAPLPPSDENVLSQPRQWLRQQQGLVGPLKFPARDFQVSTVHTLPQRNKHKRYKSVQQSFISCWTQMTTKHKMKN